MKNIENIENFAFNSIQNEYFKLDNTKRVFLTSIPEPARHEIKW